MLLQKSKKQAGAEGGRRLLISVSVIGSAGPLRFLVNEEAVVATVINTALKSYAQERRLPVLGTDHNDFLLYCANAGSDALSPLERIGSRGGRNFVLCKEQPVEGTPAAMGTKGIGGWKAWLNKFLSFKISSH